MMIMPLFCGRMSEPLFTCHSVLLLSRFRTANPSDFSYKHDAKHSSMLIVAQMWEDDTDDLLLEGLANMLNGVRTGIPITASACLINSLVTQSTAAGSEPLHVLRPYLFHLRDQRKLAPLHPRFLEILKPTIADHSVDIYIPQYTGEMTPEVRRDFRTSLSRHLFGWDVLLSLRMRLSLADFAWVGLCHVFLENIMMGFCSRN